MLELDRYFGESIIVGDDIVITVLNASLDKIVIGIDAPKEVNILREELYLEKQASLAGMRVFDRYSGESLIFGDGVTVTVLEANRGQVRIGIEAPKEVRIFRGELYKQRKIEDDQNI